MRAINTTKLKFITFFSASVILCMIIFSSFWGPLPSMPSQDAKFNSSQYMAEIQQFLDTYQILQVKWLQLQHMYSQQSSNLSDPSKAANINQQSKTIAAAEDSFNKTLDSIAVASVNNSEKENIDTIIASFRKAVNIKPAFYTTSQPSYDNNTNTTTDGQLTKALQSKNEMIANLENQLRTITAKANTEANQALINYNNNSTIDKQQLKQLQNELQGKNEMIGKLQTQMKSFALRSNNEGSQELKTNNTDKQQMKSLQNDLQSRNAMIAKLQNQIKALNSSKTGDEKLEPKDTKKMQDELEFLKWALRSEVGLNHTLTKSNNQLKQEKASLINQLKAK